MSFFAEANWDTFFVPPIVRDVFTILAPYKILIFWAYFRYQACKEE